jgi:hypothetical protein
MEEKARAVLLSILLAMLDNQSAALCCFTQKTLSASFLKLMFDHKVTANVINSLAHCLLNLELLPEPTTVFFSQIYSSMPRPTEQQRVHVHTRATLPDVKQQRKRRREEFPDCSPSSYEPKAVPARMPPTALRRLPPSQPRTRASLAGCEWSTCYLLHQEMPTASLTEHRPLQSRFKTPFL